MLNSDEKGFLERIAIALEDVFGVKEDDTPSKKAIVGKAVVGKAKVSSEDSGGGDDLGEVIIPKVTFTPNPQGDLGYGTWQSTSYPFDMESLPAYINVKFDDTVYQNVPLVSASTSSSKIYGSSGFSVSDTSTWFTDFPFLVSFVQGDGSGKGYEESDQESVQQALTIITQSTTGEHTIEIYAQTNQ